jgi:hypothetical protein
MVMTIFPFLPRPWRRYVIASGTSLVQGSSGAGESSHAIACTAVCMVPAGESQDVTVTGREEP